MTQRPSAYAFAGGLDETTPALSVPKGRVISCRNHESTTGGYSRVQGYERYDGRQSPSDAFGLSSDATAKINREAARSAIQRVPGSGPVRGVAALKGTRYAWRDNAAATACVLHKATPTGWQAVPLGASVDFTSGGTVVIAEGNTVTGATSGATATVKRVVTGSGSWIDGDQAGYLVLSNIVGAFVAEDLKIGANNVATIGGAPAAQSFPPGGRYLTKNHNFYGATVLKEMYGCNGVGLGFAFDGDSVVFIRTGMPVDQPIRLDIYKQHLFFGFRGGSIQHSETGEPLLWSAVLGAGEIALGSDITDIVAGIDSMHIMTEDQIAVLLGSDATDWVLQPLSTEEGQGAAAFATQNLGTPIYLDVGGLRSISTTQSYGNFKIGSLVPQVLPTIKGKRDLGIRPIASLVTKGKDQYRLFYDDGTGLSVYVGRKAAEPMTFQFPNIVRCICNELDIDTGERAFFGSDDGFVYELDRGTSFDGASILAYVQMSWDNEGSSDILKRWHKVIIEMKAGLNTSIGIFAEFDYGDGEQGVLPQQNFTTSGGGGLWDVALWDLFAWSTPAEGKVECYLDGQGENMSLVIISDSAEYESYTLDSLRKKITARGQKR